MATLCKQKKKSKRCKKRNLLKFADKATFQCRKCSRLACSKKSLCKLFEPLKDKGWPGLGNYKFLSFLLIASMCVLYSLFR